LAQESQPGALDRLLEAFPTRGLISGRLEERREGAWIVYDTDPANGVEYVLAHWQGIVACGVLAAMSRERGWPEVRGRSFTQVLDGARRLESESVIGELEADVKEASEHEVLAVMTASAEEALVTVETVQFAELNGRLAPEITVVASDPAHASALVRPLLKSRSVEGTFVLVNSDRGEWLSARGDSVRLFEAVSAAAEEDTLTELFRN
jgi:hypothetical protein